MKSRLDAKDSNLVSKGSSYGQPATVDRWQEQEYSSSRGERLYSTHLASEARRPAPLLGEVSSSCLIPRLGSEMVAFDNLEAMPKDLLMGQTRNSEGMARAALIVLLEK